MRKVLHITGWTIGIPLLLAGMAIIWLCYTQSGLQFALQQLNHVPRLHVELMGVRGKLAGPLHVDHLVLDHERARIDVQQLDVDLMPALLLGGLIAVDHARIGNVTVQYKPPLPNTPDKPINFLPAFLRLSVNTLEVSHGEYRHSNGYVLTVLSARSQVQMTRHHLYLQNLDTRTTDFDAKGAAQLDSAQVLSLSGQLQAVYRVPNGVLLQGDVQAHGPLTGSERRLELTAQLHAPHDVQSTGVLSFPNGNWLLEGDAQAVRVLLDAWWRDPTFKLEQLKVHYRLNQQGMHYVGDAVVPEWSPAILHLDADTHYARKVFTLDRADVSVPKTGVTSRTTGTITVTGGKPLLELHSNWRELRWPLHDSIEKALLYSAQGTLDLHGSGPYAYQLQARLAHQRWPGGDLTASGELRTGADSELRMNDYRLQTLQGAATGNATLALHRPYVFNTQLKGERLNPAELFGDWPGTVNVTAQINGRLGAGGTEQAFDIRVAQLGGTLRKQNIAGHGRVQYESANKTVSWQADDVALQWGRNQFNASGQMQSGAAARQQLHIKINAPALAQLYPDLSGDLQGEAQFVSHGQVMSLQLQATSGRLGWQSWQAEQMQLNAQVDLNDAEASSLSLNVAQFGAGGASLQKVSLTGEGRMSQHQFRLTAHPVSDLLPDNLLLQAQLQGGYAHDVWQGTLSQLQVVDASDAAMLQLEQAVPVLLSHTRMQVDGLCLRIDDGRSCVTASTSRDAHDELGWQLQAVLDKVPLTVRNRALAPNARFLGRVNGSVQLSAAPHAAWQGSAQWQFADADIRYVISGRERSLPIRQAEGHLQADAQGINAEAELRIGEQTVSTLTATLMRNETDLKQWPLSGVLSLSSSDAKLIPVFFADVDRANGTLASVLQLSGSLAAPRVAGSLKLLQGELDFYQVNLALRQLQLDATLSSDAQGERLAFTASSTTGVKGDQGPLQATGDFTFADAQLTGALHLTGQRLLVADLPEYRVLASPDLKFDIQKRLIKVTGEVLIPEARLQPRNVTNAVQISSDARLTHEEVLPDNSQWTVQSDVRIRMGDAVNFDGLALLSSQGGLQGRLAGSVLTRVRTGERPLGDGELSIEDGHYQIYSQKLDIKRGRLLYGGTALADPGLDVQAERVINDPSQGDITVGVYVRGTLRSPRLQFYSDSSMTQTQIVSYLLVGKSFDSLVGQDANAVRSASNTLAMQGGDYLANKLGRRIGLEQVGVETDANNQSALVIGKFLSPRLFISYGISLTEAINTVKLRYTLGKNWQLKSEAGAAKSADIEFKIER